MGRLAGAKVCDWIEKHCRVPEGRDVGKPVILRDFQREIICGIYDTPTRRGIVSVGRKNAKTAISAFLLLVHLCGPAHRPNSQLFSAAQSREQAGILFKLAAKVVRLSPTLSSVIGIKESAKVLFCPELGTEYRALSAEVSTSFGLSPVFTVHDELGQVRGPRSELYNALETASAAHDDPLSIIISTQAPTDKDLLSVLIDDALEGNDPKVKLFLWTTDPEKDDPFDVETIKKANPAFGDFQNAEEVLSVAEEARRIPSQEPDYRNLVLNQRIEASSPFVSRTLWADNGKHPLSLSVAGSEGALIYAGLDLSAVNDLTAATYVALIDGQYHAHCRFWLPEQGLRNRAKSDRVPYDVWAREGWLETTPGKSIEYKYVAAQVAADIKRLGIKRVAFDRWNYKQFKPWLIEAGMPEEEVDKIFVEFGQGYQSMSPALRELESLLLQGRIRHGNHPVLTMCAANAVVTRDPAGNRKLDKAKSRGKIDGMVSLTMAIGLATDGGDPKPVDIETLIGFA